MIGARTVAQGRKGTGDGKTPIGIRCPPDIYSWLESGKMPRDTDTGMVLRVLEQMMDLEKEAGSRLPELRAAAIMESGRLGQVIARLALEALDSRKKKR